MVLHFFLQFLLLLVLAPDLLACVSMACHFLLYGLPVKRGSRHCGTSHLSMCSLEDRMSCFRQYLIVGDRSKLVWSSCCPHDAKTNAWSPPRLMYSVAYSNICLCWAYSGDTRITPKRLPPPVGVIVTSSSPSPTWCAISNSFLEINNACHGRVPFRAHIWSLKSPSSTPIPLMERSLILPFASLAAHASHVYCI